MVSSTSADLGRMWRQHGRVHWLVSIRPSAISSALRRVKFAVLVLTRMVCVFRLEQAYEAFGQLRATQQHTLVPLPTPAPIPHCRWLADVYNVSYAGSVDPVSILHPTNSIRGSLWLLLRSRETEPMLSARRRCASSFCRAWDRSTAGGPRRYVQRTMWAVLGQALEWGSRRSRKKLWSLRK